MFSRCDLHLHSSASIESQEWLPQRFGCPESYAQPAVQYELCKARGMQLVTLTDHDTIDGGLQLVDRPDFFLSEEVTTRFPDDGCVVHVLVWNITPADHERIQALRADVFALVDYLRRCGIAHALAHPLESPNRKLEAPTLEKLVLLFSTFEAVNGRAAEDLNAGVRTLLGGLDARALRRLGAKHGLPPARGLGRPCSLVGGSDDHEHPRAATCFTEVDGTPDVAGFFEAVMAGQARAVGHGADVVGLGLAFGSTAYRFLGPARRRRGRARRRPSRTSSTRSRSGAIEPPPPWAGAPSSSRTCGAWPPPSRLDDQPRPAPRRRRRRGRRARRRADPRV